MEIRVRSGGNPHTQTHTHAHSHTHCSLEHNAAATAAAPSPQVVAWRLAPPLLCRSASPANLSPSLLLSCRGACARPRPPPPQPAWETGRRRLSQRGEERCSSWRKSPRVEAPCSAHVSRRVFRGRWNHVGAAPRGPHRAPPARGAGTLGLLLRG